MAQTHADVRRLLRRDVAALEPYPAPPSLEEFARSVGVAPSEVAKLDQNENPYGCSPRVREALARFPWYHIYPDPEQRELRARLSEYAAVTAEQIVVGNGSDELIELILRLVVEPGDGVVSAVPTFGYYATAARAAGAEYIAVPRGPAFELIPEAIAESVDGRTKVIFVASPNNPTGNSTPLAVIERLLGLGPLVVVDEAYFEFSRQTALGLLHAGAENLIIVRTFSKWAGLAGLRLGYGVFPRLLLPVVRGVKPPYSVNQAAAVAGIAALDDLAYLQGTVERILAERARLERALNATGLLHPYPSDANFLLAEVVGWSAATVAQALARKAILVRHYDSPRLASCLRISVGRPEHTDRLVAALRELDR